MPFGQGADNRPHHHGGFRVLDAAKRVGEWIPVADPVAVHGDDPVRRNRQFGQRRSRHSGPARRPAGEKQQVAAVKMHHFAKVGQNLAYGLAHGAVHLMQVYRKLKVQQAELFRFGRVHAGKGASKGPFHIGNHLGAGQFFWQEIFYFAAECGCSRLQAGLLVSRQNA